MSPLTLALALVVALLLYWLMGEDAEEAHDRPPTTDDRPPPDEPPAPSAEPPPSPVVGRRWSVVRRTIFALLGASVVLLLGLTREPREAGPARPRGDPGRAFRSYAEALLGVKRSFVPLALRKEERPEAARAQAIRDYEDAIREMPDSVLFRQQLGVLHGFEGNLEAALHQCHRVAQTERERGDTSAALEARLWERVYGTPPPRAEAIPLLRKQLLTLRLGWFEHLALATLSRRAGQKAQAEAEIDAARRQALLQLGLLGVVELFLFLLTLVGLLGGLVFLALAIAGRVRPVPARFHTGPRLLWEAFTVYMFLYALPAALRIVLPALRRPAGERGPALVVLLLFASDGLALAAVGYLWASLARRGLGLAEIGLHARALAANVGFAFAAYVAILPWLFAIGLLTEWLGQRYFPNVAPPFHPIQALTVGARDWWVRAALYVIAAVGAPFFEELFFRGVLYGALRRQFGAAVGVIGSAALFAGLHPQLPLGFLPLFFLGAAFAVVYEWRQSLVPGILMHSAQNSLAFLLINLLYS